MQGFFLGMMSPFLNTGSSMQRKVAAFQGGLSTLQQLETEVKNLRLENRNLKATNQLLADLAGENKRLRTALTYRERSTFKLLPARVISRDPSSWWNTVRIDRGFADGVKTDMAVLTEEGLVGKTTTVAKNISIVLLVSDENCKVASNVEGTREQGILAGERMANSQAPSLMLRFLSREANLQPGQKIFSSGVGGVFPAGVLLGTVREFTAMELDGRASIVPAVDLTTLDDVFVVKETR
jgi:rod shape-determining protein MreC